MAWFWSGSHKNICIIHIADVSNNSVHEITTSISP
jgi:hypothetical protein